MSDTSNDAVELRVHQLRASQKGRGRDATSPFGIPRKGWKDILLRTKEEIGNDRVTLSAAGVTFYLLLALFPALAAFISLYGLVADPLTLTEHMAALRGIVPASVVELVRGELERFSKLPSGGLTFGVIFGVVAALWSADAGTRALFEAMNIAYDETEKRSFVQLRLRSLGFTGGGILFGVILLNVVVVLPALLQAFHLDGIYTAFSAVFQAVLILTVANGGIALLYRYGPSRSTAKWNWIFAGSSAAAVIWLLLSWAFSFYMANFADYSATYGSLGATVGLMMWIYLTSLVLVAGAELNSEIEHQTAKDSTTGTPKPLGERGATMADTVGSKA